MICSQRPFLFILLAMLTSLADANDRPIATIPTTLMDVVESTLQHFPLILAANSDIAATDGLALATRGIFDPRIDSLVSTQQGGYYENGIIEAGLVQDLPFMNSRVFGGYRQSDGDFAGYEGRYVTRSDGEARMGFALSLWRNREIDDRRAAITMADLQVLVQQQQLRAEQLKLLEQAYIGYARWLLAHRLEEAYQELLALATARGQGLETSVEAGNTARIVLVENRQSIVQREALVTDARRQIDVAAEQLALFLRDGSGNSLYPRYDLALALPAEAAHIVTAPIGEVIAQALDKRPELAIAQLAQQQSEVKKRVAQNLAKPQLDLRVYTTRDFGSGPPSLGGIDNTIDLSISIPLATREARGKAASAQAELDGLAHRIQLLEDQLAQDIRTARVTLEATRKLEYLAIEELAVTEELARAEQQRFDSGQSDFFLLNQRERQMAEALLKRWQSHLIHQMALAEYYAASVNQEALGAETLATP